MNQPSNMKERLEALHLYEIYSKLFDRWNVGSDEGTREMHDALDACNDFCGAAGFKLLTDDNGDPMICPISKVPLIDTDQTEVVLRSALGLPPRAEVEAEGEMFPSVMDGVSG